MAILVVEAEPDHHGAWTLIEDANVFLKARDGSVSEGDVRDLRVGEFVQVWFTGLVLDSDPLRATASDIAILVDHPCYEPGSVERSSECVTWHEVLASDSFTVLPDSRHMLP